MSLAEQFKKDIVEAFGKDDYWSVTHPVEAYGAAVSTDTHRWALHALKLAAQNAQHIEELAEKIDSQAVKA